MIKVADQAEGEVTIAVEDFELKGELMLPPKAAGVVLFAHGSGSSRHSPRNQFVARRLREFGAGTLLFDLLTAEEEEEDSFRGHLRFDIELLSERLLTATQWYHSNQPERRLGYFGSSTGGAAALVASARSEIPISAIVSRGGRPDLAGRALPAVTAPTLLLVGSKDSVVIDLNQEAATQLRCRHELRLVPGATHLFEEPGALEQVAAWAGEWFTREFQKFSK